MPENIQEPMHALITQHGSVLAALATLRQQPKIQQNDEQTNSLKNLVPHINALAKFNQNTSKSTCERCNHLHGERCAKQYIELTKPSETPQE